MTISIHAPYKRVRPGNDFSNTFKKVIFQSTHPTRECDGCSNVKATSFLIYFNPRTLQESATLGFVELFVIKVNISIHAPYKRVRQNTNWKSERHRYFNPRTLQESATAIYSKKITFSQYIGLKILIRNKKYPSLK